MPDLDLKISLVLLFISFIVGLITWGISKKWLLGLAVFSVLGNLSFLINIESRMFFVYNFSWLKYVTIFFWPIINIFLIIQYRNRKNENKAKK